MADYRTKETAVKKARVLLKRFPKKSGWIFYVFESLGWHFHFVNKHTKLVQVNYDDDKFWCLIGSKNGGALWATPDRCYRSDDPILVLKRTISYAQHAVDEYNRIVNDCRRALG